MLSPELEQLIKLFSKLPGLGPRSARRAILQMVKHKDTLMLPLSSALKQTAENTKICEKCGNIDTHSPCSICQDPKRDRTLLCVVEEVADLWAIERSKTFKGMYHILGGTLSAIDGIGPNDININKLEERVKEQEITEIILATNATVDGQTTAHYITERLKPYNVNISQIAHGIPMGGELDYLDDGTLGAALKARRPF